MIKNYLFLLFLFLGFFGNAQETQLSSKAEISILTIGPGENLNDSFGHNAFRVKDSINNIDVTYNYGTFDFNTPNFYLKFTRGKLYYKLDYNNYNPFYNYYVRQNRWINEQVLNLNLSEKQTLFNYLLNNAKPENRDYMYDFLFDNCATRMRDVLVTVLGNKLEYKDNIFEEEYTFRGLIQKNVNWNSWESFGMDIAIGAVVDKKATEWEYQFLPKYVMEAANEASITRNGKSEKLVKKSNFLFKNTPKENNINFFTSPLFVVGLLGLFILFITYNDFKNQSRSRYLDAIIFVITGIIGLLLLLLWFATDHSTTTNNYNVLWAFPLSLLFVRTIAKKSPPLWLGKYIFFLILMLTLISIHWITGVQVFTYGLIPLFIALFIRYLYVFLFIKKLNQ
ncbi:MAG: DUF4105 domain-containing protein [Flavobacteriaceae bacterium]|nr:DUF4105 domain-containing protein [Flavobacteriaceae bacterium]